MELKDYIRVIRARKLWFIGVFLGVLGVYTLVADLTARRVFHASCQLVVNPTRVPGLFQGLETYFPSSAKMGFDTRVAGLSGRKVQRLAAETLLDGPDAAQFGPLLEGLPDREAKVRALAGLVAGSYRVQALNKTELVEISVEADSREKAVALLNALADAAIAFHAQFDGRLLAEAQEKAAKLIQDNRKAAQDLVEKLKAFRAEHGYTERDVEVRAAERASLARERDELGTRLHWVDRLEQWTLRRKEEEARLRALEAERGPDDPEVARLLAQLELTQREHGAALRQLGGDAWGSPDHRARVLAYLVDRQALLERGLDASHARLSALEKDRSALVRKREMETGQFLELTVSRDSLVSALGGRLDAERQRLEALRARYTELHPAVAASRAAVADLEQEYERSVRRFRQNAEREHVYQLALLDLEEGFLRDEATRQEQDLGKLRRDLEAAQDEQLRSRLDAFALEKDYLAEELKRRDEGVARLEQEVQRLEAFRLDEQPILDSQRQLQADNMLLGTFLAKSQLVAEAGGSSPLRPVDRYEDRLTPQDARAEPVQVFALFWFILVIALLVSLGVVFTLEYMDTTLKTEQDLRRHLNLPVLGIIPRLPKGRPVLLTSLEPKDALAELYQSTATLLRSAARDLGLKVFAVTSTVPDEGKTTASINLAVALARKGVRVVLVDADLRKPQIHVLLGVANDRGLSRFLQGEGEGPQDVLLETSVENLRVVPSGPRPDDPGQLLESVRMRALLEELKGGADFVLCDTPPLSSIGDTLTLAAACDATLFIVGAGLAEQRRVAWAKHLLSHIEAKVLGCLLNRATVEAQGYYDYALYEAQGRKRFRG